MPERLADSLPPGYDRIETLAASTQGVVYRARQRALGRTVILKRIRSDWNPDPHAAARFEREARALQRVRSRHVVPLLDYGEHGGSPFLTMPDLGGEDLDSYREAQGGSLPPETVERLLRELLAGLAAAHDAGVLHRDIKPANILVIPDETFLLIDFGIGKFERDQAGLTSSGVLIGTPGYLAPAILHGEVGWDPRDDLYSLGVTAYEQLTGTRLFDGVTAPQALRRQLAGDIPPLAARSDPPPARLAEVIEAMIRPRRDQRPPDAVTASRWLGDPDSATPAPRSPPGSGTAVFPPPDLAPLPEPGTAALAPPGPGTCRLDLDRPDAAAEPVRASTPDPAASARRDPARRGRIGAVGAVCLGVLAAGILTMGGGNAPPPPPAEPASPVSKEAEPAWVETWLREAGGWPHRDAEDPAVRRRVWGASPAFRAYAAWREGGGSTADLPGPTRRRLVATERDLASVGYELPFFAATPDRRPPAAVIPVPALLSRHLGLWGIAGDPATGTAAGWSGAALGAYGDLLREVAEAEAAFFGPGGPVASDRTFDSLTGFATADAIAGAPGRRFHRAWDVINRSARHRRLAGVRLTAAARAALRYFEACRRAFSAGERSAPLAASCMFLPYSLEATLPAMALPAAPEFLVGAEYPPGWRQVFRARLHWIEASIGIVGLGADWNSPAARGIRARLQAALDAPRPARAPPAPGPVNARPKPGAPLFEGLRSQLSDAALEYARETAQYRYLARLVETRWPAGPPASPHRELCIAWTDAQADLRARLPRRWSTGDPCGPPAEPER